jgi:hypothetical protein
MTSAMTNDECPPNDPPRNNESRMTNDEELRQTSFGFRYSTFGIPWWVIGGSFVIGRFQNRSVF